MAKREFLMLAHPHNEQKHGACPGWSVSEKLDGVRAFWDGGISRGILASDVPYANTAKHDRYVDAPIATGMWTRYGQPIHAPKWFLDLLPPIPLDGELWAGYEGFQKVTSIVRTNLANQSDWSNIQYLVFDSPPLETVFAPGKMDNSFFKKKFEGTPALWASLQIAKIKAKGIELETLSKDTPFYQAQGFLKKHFEIVKLVTKQIRIHKQITLPSNTAAARQETVKLMEIVEQHRGEGLMLRSPISFWEPERSWNLLKVKKLQTMEGEVIGYKWGKPTDMDKSLTGNTTNKLLGLMGCVIIKLDSGVIFDLGSGFTETERVMGCIEAANYSLSDVALHGQLHPGKQCEYWVENPKLKRGSRITFKYRELTDDNIPKEARFDRLWEPV